MVQSIFYPMPLHNVLTNFLILRCVMMEKGPMYGNLKYKQLSLRATWKLSWWVLRSFSFEWKIWRVQVANLHSGARALSCPSRCQKLDKILFRHLLCWNASTVFAVRLLSVFLQRSEILYWENKTHKEFRELGFVKECATVTLLIISAVFPYLQLNFYYVVKH